MATLFLFMLFMIVMFVVGTGLACSDIIDSLNLEFGMNSVAQSPYKVPQTPPKVQPTLFVGTQDSGSCAKDFLFTTHGGHISFVRLFFASGDSSVINNDEWLTFYLNGSQIGDAISTNSMRTSRNLDISSLLPKLMRNVNVMDVISVKASCSEDDEDDSEIKNVYGISIGIVPRDRSDSFGLEMR